MQVRVNANHTIQTQASLENWAATTVRDALSRFAHDITSVEVHFSDENGERISPDQRRCMIEARLTGHAPVAVSDYAERLDDALRGATDKLKHAIEHALAKGRTRSRESIRRDAAGLESAPADSDHASPDQT